MPFLRIILWPLSLLYGLVVYIRNLCYNRAWLKQQSFDLPIIAFGNLRVGGTGKTPHLIRTAQKLDTYKLAVLSRGYKRHSKGFVLLNTETPASISGDEPFLIRQSLGSTPVAVCENRVEGVLRLLSQLPDTECILLDDAYQHRALKAGFYILLTPYHQPWYKDALLPAGRLREPGSARKRAQCFIVSQCPPDLSREQAMNIRKRLRPNKDQEVYFSVKKPVVPEHLRNKEVYLLSGLADNTQFADSLKEEVKIIHHFRFADHHTYTSHDLDRIWKKISHQKAPLLLTSKDMVKVQHKHSELDEFLIEIKLEIAFLFDAESTFLQSLRSFIESYRDRFGDISGAERSFR